MSGLRRTPPQRVFLAVGAVITVLAAVLFDLFAGEARVHAVTLGVITALAAVVRVRLAGRRRSSLQFVCGCIISQPVIHYAAKLLPHANLEHGAGNSPGSADLLVAGMQTAVVLAIVVALTYLEQTLFALAVRAVRLCVVQIRSTRPGPECAQFVISVAPGTDLLVGRYCYSSIARRGPPVLSASS